MFFSAENGVQMTYLLSRNMNVNVDYLETCQISDFLAEYLTFCEMELRPSVFFQHFFQLLFFSEIFSGSLFDYAYVQIFFQNPCQGKQSEMQICL